MISCQVNGSRASRAGLSGGLLVAGQSGSVSTLQGVNDPMARTLDVLIGPVVLIAFTLPLLIVVTLAINYEQCPILVQQLCVDSDGRRF
jgi:hypothetical protein